MTVITCNTRTLNVPAIGSIGEINAMEIMVITSDGREYSRELLTGDESFVKQIRFIHPDLQPLQTNWKQEGF